MRCIKLLEKILCLCCLLFVIFLQSASAADSAPLVLQDSEAKMSAARHISTFGANKNGLEITQMSSSPYREAFVANAVSANNYGYHNNDFWLRLNVRSESSASWYLLIDQVVFGKYELFIQPENGGAAGIETTPEKPLFSPVKGHRTPAWKLDLPQHITFTVYIKVHSSRGPLMLPVKLMHADAFLSHSNYQYAFYGMVFSCLLILTLYNFILFFGSGEKSHFVFIAFLLLYQVAIYRFVNIFPPFFELLVNSNKPQFISLLFIAQLAGSCYWYLLYQNTGLAFRRLLKLIMIFSFVFSVATFFLNINNMIFSINCILLMIVIPIVGLMTFESKARPRKILRNNYLITIFLVFSLGVYAPIYSGLFPEYPVESVYIGMIGHVVTVLLFSMNHAEHNRRLNQLAEQARASRKATHNFLATMSHELRTPMHTVLGANDLLKSSLLSETQRRHANILELAANQMLALINDILDTARIQHSSPKIISNQPFDLHQLLDELKKTFSVQVSQKNLGLSIDAGNIPKVKFTGDEKHLKQVLINLIGNAIKYTQDGKVNLQVDIVHSETQHENNKVYFAVSDTGHGIPAEHHAFLFQPFYQAENSYSRPQGGAGLGLAISHKLVQHMGGELRFNSTPGQGSCFFFTLDLPVFDAEVISAWHQPEVMSADVARPRTLPAAETETGKKPLSGLRILLVDDGELNLIIGEQLLKIQGADVSLAQSGSEALQVIAEKPFDLVLMDVSMPGIDGYETTRMIRQNTMFRSLPIIALTAHAIEGERERCIAVGMDDYLSKPFQTEQLLKLIGQYCA